MPPSIFTSEPLMELPLAVRMTGIGLRFYVDDHGRGSANPAMIKGQLWPIEQEITEQVIDEHLVLLEDAGYIHLYTAGGRTLLALADWPSVDRPSASDLPPPQPRDILAKKSRVPREDVAVVEEREKREERGAGESAGESEEDPHDRAPSPFCPKHQPYGTTSRCGPCGTARKGHELWLLDHAEPTSEAT